MSNESTQYFLSTKQLRILTLTYKFRFITSTLLASYLGISRIASFKSLKILQDNDYLASHYTSDFKLKGKAARYYLSKKSLICLRDKYELHEASVHAQYKNRNLSTEYIDHHINIFAIYTQLTKQYPETFNIYSQYELGGYDGYPDKLPDLYMSNRDPSKNNEPMEYFIELRDTQFFVTKKRLDILISFFEEQGWHTDTNPTLLFVLPDGNTEHRFQVYAQNKIQSAGVDDDILVMTASLRSILSKQDKSLVWSNVLEPEKLLNLI